MSEQPHNTNLKIGDALREASDRLRAAGISDARPDARALLSHTLARDHAFLITHSDEEIEPAALALFRQRIARRAAGEPLQYITGRQEFYNLDFEVNSAVLIPRPETELLVEVALELLRETPSPLLCDVGTGSGCIPITLLYEREDARAVGLDISTGALAVAARNAERHAVGERLTLRVSDCFAALDSGVPRFTLITSNPPYLAARDIPRLQREVRDHEPRIALMPAGDDGDGLSMIRRLIKDAPRYLMADGHLLIEIGYNHHEAIASLVEPNIWSSLDIRRDLQGIPRTVVLRRRQP